MKNKRLLIAIGLGAEKDRLKAQMTYGKKRIITVGFKDCSKWL